MKILGIVAEYNPFHNGHKYHIEESKKKIAPDFVVCVMSGNFVQRGEPAVQNKFIRSQIAVSQGADLVIELPAYFSVSTAEVFAHSAVSVLNNCGITHLSFGSESDDLSSLKVISDIVRTEPSLYKSALKTSLDSGLSFPKSREIAVNKVLGKSSSILKTPNNILGIEYLKAIHKINPTIVPVAIKRFKADYHSLVPCENIASATALRKILKSNESVSDFVPYQNIENPVFFEDFEKLLLYKLRTVTKETLAGIPDVTEGLENRIIDSLAFNRMDEIINYTKTRRYPETRIKRILINLLLNITKSDLALYRDSGYCQYLRVLAYSEKGKKLLPQIAGNSSVPVVTSVNRFLKNANDLQKKMLNKDIEATNIYSILINEKYNIDYTNKLTQIKN